MTWISSKLRKPDYNVSVLVFIPEEDNHITAGMWDISNKWVLLDEYRVPKSEVTYWQYLVSEPEDKSYTPSTHTPDEMDTTTEIIRTLNQRVYQLEKWNNKMLDIEEQNHLLVEALTESKQMLQWHLDKSQPFNRYDQSDFFNGTANAITQAETILQSIHK